MCSFLKIIIAYFVPVLLCLTVQLFGLGLLWIKKTQKVGKVVVTLGFLLFAVFSIPFFPNMFLSHFEQVYPSFAVDPNDRDNSAGIKYVVVLAGCHVLDPEIPITGQFSYEGLVRLIEGIRLYKKYPGTKLILSGGKSRDSLVSDAELMRDLALDLGVPKNDMILEKKSMNTSDEARLLKPVLRKERFLLVTSASHMPRSMSLFRKLGMNPVAVPTGHLVKRYEDHLSFMPSASNLRKTETAFYEMLATVKNGL